MSTIIEVSTNELSSCFSELALLIPKGSKDLPVGIDLQAGILSFYHNAGTVYLHTIEVEGNEVEHCTVLFYNISELLTATGDNTTCLEFLDTGLHIYNSIADLQLSHGYSTVTYPELPNAGYINLPATGWKDNLQTVLNMGLDKLYMKTEPIIVAENESVLKYANTWVKCRTPALSLNKILDIEHIRLLNKFNPNSYQILSRDSILFKHGNALLLLPCKTPTDLKDTEEFFRVTMSKLSEPVTISVSHYNDSVRCLSKICNKAVCNLVIFESGVKTTVDEAGAAMSVTCGKTGKVIGTAQIPIAAWLVFLRALGTERIQIMIGGDILCLRNQSLIILTHARS